MSDYGRSSKKEDESSSHPKWGAALFLMALLAIGAYCYYHRDNPTSIKTPPPVASEPSTKNKEKEKEKSKDTKSGNATTLEEVIDAFLKKYKKLPVTCCAVKEFYQMIEAHPEWGIDTKNPNNPSNQALKDKLSPMVWNEWGAWKGWDLQSVCESFIKNGAQCVAKTCPTLKASMQKSKKQCT